MQFKKQNAASNTELELDHELPPAENDSTAPSAEQGPGLKDPPSPEAELEKVRTERAAYLDRAARLQAEFDNFRKRNAKEQQEYREYALADALKQLLPILDSLDRAVKTNAASLEDFQSGIELIDKQFHDALAKLGVQPASGGPDGRHQRRGRQPCSRRAATRLQAKRAPAASGDGAGGAQSQVNQN
jgi:molecular chaperone GrpE (heat shock protein)